MSAIRKVWAMHMKWRAIVFVRQTGAKGLGHVGWAFDCADGTFDVGSIENPDHTLRTNPRDMGFWTIRTRDPIQPVRERHYTEFKVIQLDQADPIHAWQVVAWVSQQPYDVVGHNCMNATYDVLRAFGIPDLPVPAHHWEPNHWFNRVRGESYTIDADVSLEGDGRNPMSISLVLPNAERLFTDVPDGIETVVPTWRIPNTPEWHEFQAAIANASQMLPKNIRNSQRARRGIIARLLRLIGIHQAHV